MFAAKQLRESPTASTAPPCAGSLLTCERAEAAAQELAKGELRVESGKASLVSTRNEVRRAWLAVGDILIRERQPELAGHVRRFADQMPPPMMEKEWATARLADQGRDRRTREGPTH
jgi:hypothetical protein